MSAPEAGPAPEFSRPVSISRLPPDGRFAVAAEARERAALARRFDLVSIDRLAASVRLTRLADQTVRLDAALEAEIVQSCVVTLDPVPAQIVDEFTLMYAPRTEAPREIELTGEEEAVEPLAGDTIDIGEAVAQQLSLALDPYPHAPGAVLPDEAASPAAPEDHPFAALARLRQDP